MTTLKFRRLQENITQAEAATRLGIGVSAYALIESGRMRPSQAQMKTLRRAFGGDALAMLDEVGNQVKSAK